MEKFTKEQNQLYLKLNSMSCRQLLEAEKKDPSFICHVDMAIRENRLEEAERLLS